jgi:cysteine desulfurase
VLAAMGVEERLAACALRASFGWSSGMEDVHAAIQSLAKLRERVRGPKQNEAA